MPQPLAFTSSRAHIILCGPSSLSGLASKMALCATRQAARLSTTLQSEPCSPLGHEHSLVAPKFAADADRLGRHCSLPMLPPLRHSSSAASHDGDDAAHRRATITDSSSSSSSQCFISRSLGSSIKQQWNLGRMEWIR